MAVLDQIEMLIQSPFTGLCAGVVLGALALSGRFDVTATHLLLAAAWAIAVVGLRGQPTPILIGTGLLWAGALILLAYWFQPDKIPAFAGELTPKNTVLFSSETGFTRKIQFGESKMMLVLHRGAIFRFLNDTNFKMEIVNGRLNLSTQIREPSGELIAELIRNQWKIKPPKTWDRNYTNDALEVKNNAGHVVLQVRILTDRIQIQGEWWDLKGNGSRWVGEKNGPGSILTMHSDSIPVEPHIEPIFEYPSETHFGKLRK